MLICQLTIMPPVKFGIHKEMCTAIKIVFFLKNYQTTVINNSPNYKEFILCKLLHKYIISILFDENTKIIGQDIAFNSE